MEVLAWKEMVTRRVRSQLDGFKNQPGQKDKPGKERKRENKSERGREMGRK